LWWDNGRLSLRDVVSLIPMFAIGLMAGLNTALMEKHHVGAQGLDWEWTIVERFLIAGRAVWFYAFKIVWPDPLIFIYPKWQIDANSWWQYGFLAAFFGLVGYLWYARHRLGRGPLVAVLFFAGTLFPALGFIDVYPMRFSFVADHFQYLASIGIISLLAAGSTTLASRLRVPEIWTTLAALVVLLSFARISMLRCFDYMNAETLWTVTIADNPDCWMAEYNLGAIRFQQQRFQEAYGLLTNSLRPRVNNEPGREERADINFYLGACLTALGKPDEAADRYRKARDQYKALAATEDPPDPATYNNLGIVYGVLQQLDDAIRCFERSFEIDPTNPQVALNLGELYFRANRFEDSEASFLETLKLDPRNARASYNLGAVALAQGRRREAIEYLRQSLRVDPNFTPARATLEQVLASPDDGSDPIMNPAAQ
jgi:tetratricopeptide (TPR) repeat protein